MLFRISFESFNIPGSGDYRLIMDAIRQNLLLSDSFPYNDKTSNLRLAAYLSERKLVKKLIAYGADKYYKSSNGDTALTIAVRKGRGLRA